MGSYVFDAHYFLVFHLYDGLRREIAAHIHVLDDCDHLRGHLRARMLRSAFGILPRDRDLDGESESTGHHDEGDLEGRDPCAQRLSLPALVHGHHAHLRHLGARREAAFRETHQHRDQELLVVEEVHAYRRQSAQEQYQFAQSVHGF